MVALTQDAQGHLDRYLRQIKSALRGHPRVDADDVERDVLGHIDAELAGKPEPVSVSNLHEVLQRLGTPDRWVPSEDLPAWRRVFNRLHSGPEDWRLAYLTLACVVLGFWFPPFLIASFPVARATLAQMDAHDEPVGPRGWLVYPPLVLWYAALAAALLIGPAPGVVVSLETSEVQAQVARFTIAPFWLVVPSLAAVALGIWWTILGLFLRRFVATVRLVFWPFAEWFDARYATRLSLIGALLAVLSGGLLLLGSTRL